MYTNVLHVQNGGLVSSLVFKENLNVFHQGRRAGKSSPKITNS
jgi:hypothetical protein